MGLTYSSVVGAEPDEVFGWHARPGAIFRLMPPWQPVRVRTEAASVRDGTAVLGLPGGLRWVAHHDPGGYDPPRQFVDVTQPPLGRVLRWRHTHQFAPAVTSGTLVTDVVDTQVPGRLLRPMFGYRHRQLAGDLAAHARARAVCPEPLTIAMTGASGLIGTVLGALLTTGGHRVIRLVRHAPLLRDERHWQPDDPDPDLLSGVDAVVHLAGASIAGRFTAERKREILLSRTGPTRALAVLAAKHPGDLRAFVTASAVGFYGADRGDEVLTEASERGDGFLADVVTAWEDAAGPATAAGVRTVQVRTGLVQTPAGGVLRLLYPLFAVGLGGPLAGGAGWQPWIEVDDLLDIYLRAVTDPALSGPVNAVAPSEARNAEYTRVLGRVLRRPALIPVPAAGPRLLLGAEGAKELAEASQRVHPAALAAAGHRFRFPELDGGLRHVLGKDTSPELPQQRPIRKPAVSE